VSEGDTLGWIASREFGDSTQWRRIAEANHLQDVRELRPGMVLVIPNA
jgi:nucleoid-associated protein YgaU